MNIISQLSSQTGDKTEGSNIRVAQLCLKNPKLLDDLAQALKEKDNALVGDIAEVFTKVAEQKPQLVKPYLQELIPLLAHKYTRARWEAMHALALTAEIATDVITPLLPQLKGMSITDTSTIVRDYCVVAISNYAKTNKKAAREALVALELILEQWKEKQAARVFQGLQNIIEVDPTLKSEVLSLAKPFEQSSKSSVKKAYKSLMKVLEK